MLDSSVKSLTDLCGGKLEAKFKEKLTEALENIYDEKYNPNDVRAISMKVKLHPDPGNREVGITCEVDFQRPKAKPMGAICVLAKHEGKPGIWTSDPQQQTLFNDALGNLRPAEPVEQPKQAQEGE